MKKLGAKQNSKEVTRKLNFITKISKKMEQNLDKSQTMPTEEEQKDGD